MRVLALNPGSSSLRFGLLRMDPGASGAEPERLAWGVVDSIGPQARARAGLGREQPEAPPVRARDHAEATGWMLEWLAARLAARRLDTIDAVGIRVVHGGGLEQACLLVTAPVEEELGRLCALAPLHNQASLATLRRARRGLPAGLPLCAVLDTAFHAGMPEVARTYAIPHELARRHGIRRFGFHGIAIASVLERHARRTSQRGPEERIVVLHLGSGASVTAVRDGRSVDTSMGFSPLEGLVMATRSGDVDPSLVAHLARAEGTTADEVVRWLNESSGLLGVSGRSKDMREIERLRAEGDPRARLAFELFVHCARKHLAAMAAVLGGVDAVLFSGGIGENSAAARAAICSEMEWGGITLDPALNAEPGRSDGRISPAQARVGVHVVPADEERIIARETFARLAPSRTP